MHHIPHDLDATIPRLAGSGANASSIWRALLSVLAVQAILILAIAAGFYAYHREWAMLWSALFGGSIGLGTSGLSAFRLAEAARADASLAGLYFGAVERFIFVAAAFAVALAVLKLAPVPLLAGFAGTQLAYFIAATRRAREMQSGDQHGG
ncbi:MAG: ATP synthase subunit I [Burkholderiales bacterium]